MRNAAAQSEVDDALVEACLPLTIGFLVLASAIILAALGFEHIGGYQPCALCLMQRIPYYVAIPVSIVTLIAIWLATGRFVIVSLLVVLFAIMAYSTGLAAYHSGVEWALLAGPAGCAPAGGAGADAASVLSGLQSGQIEASCTEAVWRFAGLSFAGWNAVFSLILALIALTAAVRAWNVKAG